MKTSDRNCLRNRLIRDEKESGHCVDCAEGGEDRYHKAEEELLTERHSLSFRVHHLP